MLPGRLTRTGLAAASLLVPLACGGSGSGSAIEDGLIRPGITAIDEARSSTCGTNERLLLDAIDIYEVLNGEPPADEAALVEAGLLRDESTDFDIAEGRLVPVDPDCDGGSAATPAPGEVDIVTDVGSIPTVDELFGFYDDEFIAQVGGPECARQLAAIAVAGLRYEDREGTAPLTFDDLQGDLDEAVTDWTYDAATDQLLPVEGTGCTLGDLEPNR